MRLEQNGLVALLHGGQGQTQIILAEAHGGHGGLDGDGVDLGEQGPDQGQILGLQRHGPGNVAGKELVADLHGLHGGPRWTARR